MLVQELAEQGVAEVVRATTLAARGACACACQVCRLVCLRSAVASTPADPVCCCCCCRAGCVCPRHQVLPLPDGAVIGRCNLQQVGATAQAAAHAACDRAAAELVSRQRAQQQQQAQAADGSDTVRSSSVHGSSEEASASSSQEAEGVITSLNTTVQRGIAIQVRARATAHVWGKSVARHACTFVVAPSHTAWLHVVTMSWC